MRAFVGAPQLVVGDEPLSAVDLVARLRLREAMLASCREDDATFVFVTHDLGDVAALATRALVLAGQPAVLTADLAVVGSDTRALERALREPVAECPGDAPPSPRLARLTGALA